MAREPKKIKTMLGNLRPEDVRSLGIGLELSVVIGGMAWGGHWLDQRWGTEPWLLMTGVCIGTFGGGWHAMKMANGGKLPDFGFKPKAKSENKSEYEKPDTPGTSANTQDSTQDPPSDDKPKP